MWVYFTFVSSTAISSLFDSSTSTQQNALLVALSFYYYYRHYYYELYIHIILFSNHYIYFCWVHSAYGPCSLSVLPPYKNQKSFFLLPDDFTKTPIKNNRYEYSYYILTTQPAKNEYYSFTLKYCRTNEYDCLFEGEDTIVNQQYSFLHIFIICSLLKQWRVQKTF